MEINADVVADYYQVEPIPPQPDSVTTYTRGIKLPPGVSPDEAYEKLIDPPKRTPQIYRQCWKILRHNIDYGNLIRSRSRLLREMDSIEKQVRG